MLSDQHLQVIFGLQPRTVRLFGDVIRASGAMMVALIVGVLALSYLQAAKNTASVRHLQDFGIFYESARKARAGADMYDITRLPDDDELREHSNLNPPHFHLLVLPFTYLAPRPAFVAWLAMSATALAGSLLLIRRSLQLGTRAMFVIAGVAIAWAPMFATLLTGQIGPLLLLPFTLAWHRARQHRDLEAGLWIGLLTSVKSFFLLFLLYFLFVKRVRVALVASITMAATFMVGVAAFGVSAHRGWLEKLANVSWAEHYLNASLLGLIERTLSRAQWPQTPAIGRPWLVTVLWLVIAIPIGIAAFVRLRQLPNDRQLLLVMTTTLLLSPLGWIYYGWFLLPPFAASYKSGQLAPRGAALALASIAVVGFLIPPPLPFAILSSRNVFSTVTFGSVYSWSLISLWAVAMSRVPSGVEVSGTR